MTNYTIVLADSNILYRQRLRENIKDINGLKVLGEADNKLDLIKLVKEKRPHLIITETYLRHLKLAEGIKEIKQIDPSVRILIISEDSIFLQEAFSAGVDGYILKENKADQLVKAIEAIRRGNTYLPIDLYEQVKHLRETSTGLSKREKEIIKLIAEGKNSKEISKILYISIYTVRRHRDNIMRKLELKGLADLIRFAVEHGYIEIPETTIKKESHVDTPEIKPFILRSIEFSPEHYQAGLTILNYFGTIVRQKYAGLKVKVNIQQEDLIVRMIIETDEGNVVKIEKTLEEYGLVIKGEKPIDEFMPDPYQVADLKQQLRLAKTQIEYQKDLLALTKNMHESRIYNLEEEVNRLHSYIGSALKLLDNKDMIVESSIKLIKTKLTKDISQDDFLEIKAALEKIRNKDQAIFLKIVNKIYELFIEKAISGAAGHALFEFIKRYIFS